MKAAGEKNGRAKMTWPRVRRVRRIYRECRQKKWNDSRNNPGCFVSILDLSIEEDVSYSTMHSILTEKSWRDKNEQSVRLR